MEAPEIEASNNNIIQDGTVVSSQNNSITSTSWEAIEEEYKENIVLEPEEEEIQVLRQKSKSIQSQLESLREREKHRQDYVELQRLRQISTVLPSDATSNQNDLVSQLKEQLLFSRAKSSELQKQNTALHFQLEQIKHDYEEQSQHDEDDRTRLENIRQKNLREAIELSQKVASLEREQYGWSVKAESAQAELLEAKSSIKSLQHTVSNLEKESLDAFNANKELCDATLFAKTAIQPLSQNIEELVSNVLERPIDLNTTLPLAAQFERMAEPLSDVTSVIRKMQEDLNRTSALLKQKTQESLELQEARNAEKQDLLNQSRTVLDESRDVLEIKEAAIQKLLRELSNARTQSTDAILSMEELEIERDDLIKKLEIANKKKEKVTTQRNALEVDSIQKDKIIRKLRHKVLSDNNDTPTITQIPEKMTLDKQKQTQVLDKIKSLEVRIKRLDCQNKELREKNIKWAQEVCRQQECRLLAAEDSESRESTTIASLEETLQNLEERTRKAQESYENDVNILKASHNIECERYQLEIKDVQTRSESLVKELETCENEITLLRKKVVGSSERSNVSIEKLEEEKRCLIKGYNTVKARLRQAEQQHQAISDDVSLQRPVALKAKRLSLKNKEISDLVSNRTTKKVSPNIQSLMLRASLCSSGVQDSTESKSVADHLKTLIVSRSRDIETVASFCKKYKAEHFKVEKKATSFLKKQRVKNFQMLYELLIDQQIHFCESVMEEKSSSIISNNQDSENEERNFEKNRILTKKILVLETKSQELSELNSTLRQRVLELESQVKRETDLRRNDLELLYRKVKSNEKKEDDVLDKDKIECLSIKIDELLNFKAGLSVIFSTLAKVVQDVTDIPSPPLSDCIDDNNKVSTIFQSTCDNWKNVLTNLKQDVDEKNEFISDLKSNFSTEIKELGDNVTRNLQADFDDSEDDNDNALQRIDSSSTNGIFGLETIDELSFGSFSNAETQSDNLNNVSMTSSNHSSSFKWHYRMEFQSRIKELKAFYKWKEKSAVLKQKDFHTEELIKLNEAHVEDLMLVQRYAAAEVDTWRQKYAIRTVLYALMRSSNGG